MQKLVFREYLNNLQLRDLGRERTMPTLNILKSNFVKARQIWHIKKEKI
jgi:hypothetical protein